jgi:hypothetical protein
MSWARADRKAPMVIDLGTSGQGLMERFGASMRRSVAVTTSAATDGQSWQPYADGAQKFTLGANGLYLDSKNRILYSTNMAAGLWALKLADP